MFLLGSRKHYKEVTEFEKDHQVEICFSNSGLSAKTAIFCYKIHPNQEG